MILCNSCLYQFDKRHCNVPYFGEVVRCYNYVDKKYFYNHSSRRIGYIIPYDFSLNIRRGLEPFIFL